VWKHLSGEKVGVENVLKIDDELQLLLARMKKEALSAE
jgi:hypothetical protein